MRRRRLTFLAVAALLVGLAGPCFARDAGEGDHRAALAATNRAMLRAMGFGPADTQSDKRIFFLAAWIAGEKNTGPAGMRHDLAHRRLLSFLRGADLRCHVRKLLSGEATPASDLRGLAPALGIDARAEPEALRQAAERYATSPLRIGTAFLMPSRNGIKWHGRASLILRGLMHGFFPMARTALSEELRNDLEGLDPALVFEEVALELTDYVAYRAYVSKVARFPIVTCPVGTDG